MTEDERCPRCLERVSCRTLWERIDLSDPGGSIRRIRVWCTNPRCSWRGEFNRPVAVESLGREGPQQAARRRFFVPGLDPLKFAEIEREMEERERLRRERELAAAVAAAAAVEPGPPATRPAESDATDWLAVAEGLRGLAGKLRQVAEEGPGPSPG
jgi:hypothetical protein